MKKILALAAALVLTGICAAGAEERYGVAVYPGAKYDDASSKFLKESMNMDAACYRTGDGVDKVVAFYKKQKGLSLFGDATKEGALFQSKNNIDVTIQSPWMDMKTGTMMKDTLVSIVNKGAMH